MRLDTSTPDARERSAGGRLRPAVDLKHGMTLQEVQELRGKPKRTALKALSHESTPELWHGRWLVQGWDWTGH